MSELEFNDYKELLDEAIGNGMNEPDDLFKLLVDHYFANDLDSDLMWDAQDDAELIAAVLYHGVKFDHGGTIQKNDDGSEICHFFGGMSYEGLMGIGELAQLGWEWWGDWDAPFTGFTPDALRDTAYAYLGAWFMDCLEAGDDARARALLRLFADGHIKFTDLLGPQTTKEEDFPDAAHFDTWLQTRKAWFSREANRLVPGSVEVVAFPAGVDPAQVGGRNGVGAPAQVAAAPVTGVPAQAAGQPSTPAGAPRRKRAWDDKPLHEIITAGDLGRWLGEHAWRAKAHGDERSRAALARAAEVLRTPMIQGPRDRPLTDDELGAIADVISIDEPIPMDGSDSPVERYIYQRQEEAVASYHDGLASEGPGGPPAPGEPEYGEAMMAGAIEEVAVDGDAGSGRADRDTGGGVGNTEDPGPTSGGPSTKTLIKLALAVFGAAAVAYGGYVFATGGDDDEAADGADQTEEARTEDPPAESDGPEDERPSAGDGDDLSAAGSPGPGEGPTGELAVGQPTELTVAAIADQRVTGLAADPGGPADGPAAVSGISLETGEDSFEVAVAFDTPPAPWFLSVSLIQDGEMAAEASAIDGGTGPVGEIVYLDDSVATPEGALRFIPDETAADVEVDETLGQAVFSFRSDTELPIGLLIDDGGRFDVAVTLGSTPDDGPEPVVAEYRSGWIEIPAAYFQTDDSLMPVPLDDIRLAALEEAPPGVADCVLETVTYGDELLSFLNGTLGDRLVPCLFIASPVGAAAAEGIAGFTTDPTALRCVANGLALRGATADDLAQLSLSAGEWRDGLLELYAQVLDECVPLEPYYLERFGLFEYTKDGCPRIMTDYVLGRWSWERFLRDGITDASAAVRDGVRRVFEDDVNAGYVRNECLAAG
ncbi:MAG: hypothetical protein AAF547_13860 [Actinomycetota bacterium]